MAVEHVVLLKTKRAPTEAEKEKIRGLRRIPGCISVCCGENYTQRGRGYNFGIVERFESKEAEMAFQIHPDHAHVRDEVVKPLLASDEAAVLAVDFQVEHDMCPPNGFSNGLGCGMMMGFLVGCMVMKSMR